MILANWLRRVSEEPHSSAAPNRLAEALLLPWSVSMSSDEPYWRPPTPRSVWSFSWRLMGSKPVSDELPDGEQSIASHCHIDIRIFEQNFDLAMIKMRDERTIRALWKSHHQIKLAQCVKEGIVIGFAVGSEYRILQHNPRRVGWPDFLEQLAAASGQIHAHHIRRIATEHPNQRRAPVTRHRKDCLVGMDAGNQAGRSLTIHGI